MPEVVMEGKRLAAILAVVILVVAAAAVIWPTLFRAPTPAPEEEEVTRPPAEVKTWSLALTIVDEETGEAVAGAIVKVLLPDGTAVAQGTTGAEGEISFTLEEGSYTVEVAAEGYELFETAISLVGDLAKTLELVPTAPAPPAEEGITLYVITRHDTVIQEKSREAFLASDLAKRYNIVNIRFLPAAPALWRDYIEQGVVDVGWGGGPTLFDFLAREGLLQPITSDVALEAVSKIPDDIGGVPMKRFDGQGRVLWVAAAISSFGFTVNYDNLEYWDLPKPTSWKDLASDIFIALPQPQLGIADPTRSTSNTRMYEIIVQAYGWEEGWRVLMLMAANAKVFDSSDAVREAVRTGDIAVGITIDFYGYTCMLENPRTEYIIPPGESILNGDPIALVKGAKHPEAAQAFIAWVLSAEGQKVWLDPKINRMPINPEVFDTPEGQQRQDLKQLYELTLQGGGIEFSDERALATERALQEYFKAAFVDVNEDLKRAWRAVVALKDKDPAKYEQLRARLTNLLELVDPLTGQKVLFTEEYAAKINQYLGDPEILAKFREAVREAALARYKEILALATGG